MNKVIGQSISWVTLSNSLVAFVKFFIIWLIAKILNVEAVGQFTLALAVITPIMLFANMKLRSIYVKEQQANLHEFMTVRLMVSIAAIFLIILISFLFYSEILLLIIILSIIRALDLYEDMLFAHLQKNEQLVSVSKYTIAKQILLLLVFTIALVSSLNLVIALLLQLFGQLLFILFERRKIKIPNKRSFSKKAIYAILLIGIPIGCIQLLISLNTYIPRFILESVGSTELLGYFAVISYITVISNIVIGAITQSYLKSLADLALNQKFKQLKDVLYKKLYLLSFVLFVFLFVIVFLIGDELFSFVFGESYSQYTTAMLWMTVCVFWNAMNWHVDNLLLIFNKIRSQLLIVLVSSMIALPLNYYWINEYLINGAAFSMAFNYFLLFILKQLVCMKYLSRGDSVES